MYHFLMILSCDRESLKNVILVKALMHIISQLFNHTGHTQKKTAFLVNCKGISDTGLKGRPKSEKQRRKKTQL